MNFSHVADYADLLAALGVIGSLIFVGWEVSRNTREIRRTNWETIIDRFNTLWSRLSDAHVSDVVARGRQDFHALSPGDRIAFGAFYSELCLTYETMIVLGRNQVQGDALSGLPRRHLGYQFSYPGARQWWAEMASDFPLAPPIVAAVNEAIAAFEPDRLRGPI